MTMFNLALALWLGPMLFLIGAATAFYKFRLIPGTMYAGMLIGALIPGVSFVNATKLLLYKDRTNEDK